MCPLNVLAQWRDEIQRAFERNTMSCEVYYGATRMDAALLTSRDCPEVMYAIGRVEHLTKIASPHMESLAASFTETKGKILPCSMFDGIASF